MSKSLYRIYLIVGALTHSLWGYIVPFANPGILVDSLSHRLLVISPVMLITVASFFSKKIYDKIEWIVYLAIFIVTADYCYLVHINNQIFHTSGLYVVLAVCLGIINNRKFLTFYSVSFLLFCLWHIFTPSYTIPQKVTYGNMLTLICITSFFAFWRIRFLEKLDKSHTDILNKNRSLKRIGDLSAQVAHDIRSPVLALKALASTLGEGEVKKKELANKIANRVNDIADYLLAEYRTNVTADVSSKATTRPVFINEIIKEIIDEKKITLKNKGVIQIRDSTDVVVPSYLNIVEFKRVFSNILNNAIEACDKEDKEIRIALQDDSQNIFLRVKDNGMGIPAADIHKVFDKGISSKATGSGLGLFHAKEFMESIEGKITVDSQVNLGTTFTITLKKQFIDQKRFFENSTEIIKT